MAAGCPRKTQPTAVGSADGTATQGETSRYPELKRYPMDGLDGLIQREGIHLDKDLTTDGNGSLRIESGGPQRIRLYETGDLDVENARLIYQARLRTEGLEGKAYLEMWCVFAGQGQYFSRAIPSALTGSRNWTVQETPFLLQAGQNPDNVLLNLAVIGKGTVWIDDVRLLEAPLD